MEQEPVTLERERSLAGDGAGQWRSRLMGAVFPLTAGVALYGWRAGVLVALLAGSAWVALRIWQRIGRRGASIRRGQVLWMAVALAMMLPAQLLAPHSVEPGLGHITPWTLVPAAGVLLVVILWLQGGRADSHAHPAVLACLVLVALFGELLSPHTVLHPWRAFAGDVVRFAPPPPADAVATRDEAWIYLRETPQDDALFTHRAAAEQLSAYTRGQPVRQRASVSLEGMLRDAMPPLEDLVIGGHPGPIGASSAIAVLIGGLFLLYRGVIDHRVPVLVMGVAGLTMLVLPVPIIITEAGAQWLPIVSPRAHLGWPTIITFVNYQMLASPLLLTAFFLATDPVICPASRRARTAWAVILGLLAAVCITYLSCPAGPYMALLAAGLTSRTLDSRARSVAGEG